jgi:hypothetical protein
MPTRTESLLQAQIVHLTRLQEKRTLGKVHHHRMTEDSGYEEGQAQRNC